MTADGRRVISASDDRTLKVWDVESRRVLSTLASHAFKVSSCVVTADGGYVVSASGDRNCYSEAQAAALLARVDCVVGTSGAIRDDAARSFAIGFYGGLGERESVAAVYEQGRAAISLKGLPGSELPPLKIRAGSDAGRLVLAAGRPR